ncbi:hypothetical protein [Crossiella cryophila]|uniref:Uncharacterized protein n=1 Tax=Crossiella cryophila TaxID=43355 RepID=A0A7W7FS42_9PSEU|nr:hypothetical protein [Crossiella cryophila]MBB4675560.1 hypothetical protein [Crossiella cryophila]
MTNATDAVRVLRVWQTPTNPVAYRCPQGHGVLGLFSDREADTGLILACAACSHRVPVDAATVDRAAAAADTPPTMAFGAEEIPAGHGSWRGQLDNGLVRTHGWLLVGNRPVSSGLLSAIGGFLVSLGFLAGNALWPVLTTALGYGLWKLTVVRLRPASRVRNHSLITARELVEGDFVRRYGQIGPVARVESATPWTDGLIAVHFTGGGQARWEPTRQVWVAELLD